MGKEPQTGVIGLRVFLIPSFLTRVIRPRPRGWGTVKLVLVLEEDPRTREFVCAALASAGIGAERAQSDIAAYRRITSLPTLDALILDMARADSVELARFARQVIPSISLIYLGVRGTGADLNGHDLPTGEFVAVPVRPDELTSALLQSVSAQLV